MNMYNKQAVFFVLSALFCAPAHAMKGPIVKPQKEFSFDRYITEVRIVGPMPYRRIFILPYKATGIYSTQQPDVDEFKGVTLDAYEDFSKFKPLYTLKKRILINPRWDNPELLVILDGAHGIESLDAGRAYFKEDQINSLGEQNQLRIEWSQGATKPKIRIQLVPEGSK